MSLQQPPLRIPKSLLLLLLPLFLFLLTTLLSPHDLTRPPLFRRLQSKHPRIAWVTDYPYNKGKWLLNTIEHFSSTTTATNDGRFLVDAFGDEYWNTQPALPAAGISGGPFRHKPSKPLPPNYILTWTDCGPTSCLHCFPHTSSTYLDNIKSFARECSRTWVQPTVRSYYWHGHVKKVVHLVRDPFDVVASRYRGYHDVKIERDDSEWLDEHSRDYAGFTKWCEEKDWDSDYLTGEARFYPDDYFAQAVRTKCHSEFVKYVKWMNNIFVVGSTMLNDEKGAPKLIVHYEELYQDLAGTLAKLFEFAELPERSFDDLPFGEDQPIQFEFEGGFKTNWYTTAQRFQASKLMRSVCEGVVCEVLERYLISTE